MFERRWHAAVTLLVLSAVSTSVCTAADEQAKLPPKDKLHVYLLMGQSNMAGRGRMTEADRQPVARVWMLDKENRWVPASHPLHFDKPQIAGVGVGIDFAKRMCREDPTVEIGLVPCAFGGTPLSRWSKGGDLYENAVARAKIAIADGALRGVLWHQGESDSGEPETANSYGDRLAKMIADLRADLKSPGLFFVAGRLGEFYVRSGQSAHAETVDAALRDLPQRVEKTGCASAEGLEHKGDVVHFSADAIRELGRRYAAEMIRLSKP
ncbi:MAG TPA: sialate O-acetylesterase [Thermoguttaceae bacterium]|nr:sialate O-acetylesterase [Thermoguttaceae bacterium]